MGSLMPNKRLTFNLSSNEDNKLIYDFRAISKVFNSFNATGLFLYPLKTCFLMFLGVMEIDKWHEMC